MPNKEKELLVEELTEKIKNNKCIVLTEYQGLTVSEISELRAKLRPLKCEYKVVKNTLSKIAFKNLGIEAFFENLSGPTAIAIENGDPVSTAKALFDFSKDHANLKLKAGLLGDKLLSAQELKALASLPSREVLVSKFLSTLVAPLANLVGVLQGPIRNFVYVLEAVRKKQETK